MESVCTTSFSCQDHLKSLVCQHVFCLVSQKAICKLPIKRKHNCRDHSTSHTPLITTSFILFYTLTELPGRGSTWSDPDQKHVKARLAAAVRSIHDFRAW